LRREDPVRILVREGKDEGKREKVGRICETGDRWRERCVVRAICTVRLVGQVDSSEDEQSTATVYETVV